MPLYEYQCPKCGRFELIKKFSDAPLTSCPTCGRDIQKLFSAPAIQFKGSGWYITDYARKGSGGDGDGAGSAKDTAASKDKPAPKDAPAAKEGSAAKDSASTTTAASAAKDSGASGSGSTK